MSVDPAVRGEITGVVLAGGRATRMGGADKGLLRVAGRPMVEHVLRALRPQVGNLLVNANRNIDRYREFGVTVVTDLMEGFCGPLAGMASAMQVARTAYVLSVPCDSPFLSEDLAARLHRGLVLDGARIAVADSGGRLEPVFALLDRSLLPSLLAYLEAGERKIDRWYAQHPMTRVDFADESAMFLNLNTPEEVAAAEATIRSRTAADGGSAGR
ncbi:MAG: Molybdenum cofactor guanylyltransferase [Gammaproteobacteria bacterium]|nr:Molybdenum cofactor guanylyltransferase [Gammaproteobacteria bacterium]